MSICTGGCEPICFGCQLRDKGLQVSPAATPNRHNRLPGRKPEPAWERGIKYDVRPDGSRMPLLEPGTRNPLHVKQYGEHRHEIDAQVSNLKTRSTPLPDTL